MSTSRSEGPLARRGIQLDPDEVEEPLLLADLDGKLLDANLAARRMLGWDITGVTTWSSTRLDEVVEDDPERLGGVLRSLARSTTPMPVRLTFRLPGGAVQHRVLGRRMTEEPHILLRVRSHRDQFRQMTATLDLLNDEIARRLALENELQKTLDNTVLELQQANQRLRRFASSAAHDLRTPLAVIVGFAELMSQSIAPVERTQELSRRIASAARGCSEMVESLLTQAAAEAEGTNTEIHLAEEVEWVRQLTSAEEVSLEPVPPLPVVRGSRVALRQVLLNLVSNAAKHRGGLPKVRVVVEAHLTGGEWEICVSDNGPGIPPEMSERVVESGVQLDTSVPGHGMGLDLCRAVVQEHGGTFRLETSQMGGLAVCFTLPVDLQARPAQDTADVR